MKNLIDRYVYDVARRLPEKEREDVKRELTANISDMLGDDPGEAQIEAVLTELGSPALLAEQYRQNPRYLISPAMFDMYLRALKIVLPIVAAVLFCIGVITGLAEALSVDIGAVGRLIGGGLSGAIGGALQAFAWTTAGFVIAEVVEKKSGKKEQWKLSDLPDDIPDPKGEIPLSDGLVDLIVTVVFGALFIAICSGALPVAFSLSANGVRVMSVFNAEFLAACVPAIVIGAVFSAAEAIMQLVYRRWNIPVCITAVLSNIAGLCASIYVLTRQNMFSAEFISFVETSAAKNGPDSFFGLLERVGPEPFITFIIAAACLGTLIECIRVTVKTVRLKKAV